MEANITAGSAQPDDNPLQRSQFSSSALIHCVRAFQNRQFALRECFGCHGTSIDTIIMALRTGRIPPSPPHDTVSEGKLYLVVQNDLLPERLKSVKPKLLLKGITGLGVADFTLVREQVRGYAGDRAQEQEVLKALGLDWNNGDHRDAVNSAIHLEATEELQSFGNWDEAFVFDAIERSKSHKGVCLYVHKRALDFFEIVPGDVNDVALVAPEGVDLEFLCGIEPLGPIELEFFERLSLR